MSVAPRVSVIIAGHQAARFIDGAVRSALGQTLQNIEVIVVDDASTDDTASAAVRAANGDPRLRTLTLPRNGGPSAARNAGLAAARGDWIAVLDSDDAMHPDRLERLVAHAERDVADIVADALLVVREGAETAPGKAFGVARLPSPMGLGAYARDNRMHQSSGGSGYLKPLFRRSFIAAHALGYDTSLRIAEDWTFVADALAHGARFVLLDEPLYRYTVRTGSISHRLTVKSIEAMIASADRLAARHASRLSPPDRKALAQRRASLVDALAFQRFVERMKEGRRLDALAVLAKRPGGWPLLRMPIMSRLNGRRGDGRIFP